MKKEESHIKIQVLLLAQGGYEGIKKLLSLKRSHVG